MKICFKNIFIPSSLQPGQSPWRKRGLTIFDRVLLSAADSQSFLAIAYWVSFYLEGRCTLTAYHYSLTLDVGLISCSTFVASAAIVHGYSDAPLAALLRYAAAFVSFFILGIYVIYQHGQVNAPEQWPSFKKSTSALFLPSACFLDSRLNSTIFPERTDQDHDRIIDILGPPDNAKNLALFGFWITNVIMYILGFIKNLTCWYKKEPIRGDGMNVWFVRSDRAECG